MAKATLSKDKLRRNRSKNEDYNALKDKLFVLRLYIEELFKKQAASYSDPKEQDLKRKIEKLL